MARVSGIGGVFFKAGDSGRLAAWYREHLGIPVEDGGHAIFRSRDALTGADTATVWALFERDSDYFGNDQQFMVNYRVDDLDGVLAALRNEGVAVDDRVEASEFGRFGWITDPEGNRIELWQPPPAS